jgi:hypothetical protein
MKKMERLPLFPAAAICRKSRGVPVPQDMGPTTLVDAQLGDQPSADSVVPSQMGKADASPVRAMQTPGSNILRGGLESGLTRRII